MQKIKQTSYIIYIPVFTFMLFFVGFYLNIINIIFFANDDQVKISNNYVINEIRKVKKLKNNKIMFFFAVKTEFDKNK